MSSYESQIQTEDKSRENLAKKIDFSMMKYLWFANPLSGRRNDSIPKFLRNIELFKNFSDNELRLLSKYFHSRKFSEGEVVFRDGELGIGFYFVFSGKIELSRELVEGEGVEENFLSLEEYSYFGELALLQEGNRRMATAVAKNNCELVGIFKPDVEIIIQRHPVIAAKFIQSMSSALADRLYLLSYEASKMAARIKQLENKK